MHEWAAKGVATIGEGKNTRDVAVSEITPAQMRQLLMASPWPGDDAGPEALARYQVDVWLFDDCRLTDLALFTGLPVAELEEIPPSQLKKLRAKAKELNPDFFSALGRMAEAQSRP